MIRVSELNRKMMAEALSISTQCDFSTYPNPKVGAVIFNDEGDVISVGHTSCYGGDHAEIEALRKINFKAEGLNMAVTLEPCNHFGKTPPCSHAILKAGIKKVIIAKKEENGLACNGACYLQEHGVKVEFLEEFSEKVEKINRFFFKNVRTSLPWVTVKVALSNDGFLTEKIGTPTLISNRISQKHAHILRSQHMAIGVGAATVNADNPKLTVRLIDGPDPIPVIFSRNLSLNEKADVIQRNPIVITSSGNDDKIKVLRENGVTIEQLKTGFSAKDALKVLLKNHSLNSIMVEGGAALINSFLNENMIDELHIIYSQKPLGKGLKLFYEEAAELFLNKFTLVSQDNFDTDLLKIFKKKD